MTKSVVIMHFYNEALLLPFWLKHHQKYFDEGVLINYASTDESVEICAELAPGWRLINSRNEFFGAFECDAEVMDIESEYEGYWKMALNTTEFILAPNLNDYLESVEAHHEGAQGFRAHGAHMIDPPELENVKLTDEPLIKQRHWGIDAAGNARDRLIHKAKNGVYHAGRHMVSLQDVLPYGNDVWVLWYGWSPWPQVLQRKQQIKTRVPQKDIDAKLGLEHQATEEEMIKKWSEMSLGTENLLIYEDFAKVWQMTVDKVTG